VTREDIGAIRIFERETKVEILEEAAERFAKAVRGTETGGVRIEPAAAPVRPAKGFAKGAERTSHERNKAGKPAGAWRKAPRRTRSAD
jgi:ATP-dependent RNA helicase DeaD